MGRGLSLGLESDRVARHWNRDYDWEDETVSKAAENLKIKEAAEKLTDIILHAWNQMKMPVNEQNRRIRNFHRKVKSSNKESS